MAPCLALLLGSPLSGLGCCPEGGGGGGGHCLFKGRYYLPSNVLVFFRAVPVIFGNADHCPITLPFLHSIHKNDLYIYTEH